MIPPGWSGWYGAVRNGFLDHGLNEKGRIVDYGSSASDYSTDVYARRVVDIVRRRAPSAQPFFVWFTPFAPHSGRPADPDDPPHRGGGRRAGGIATASPAPRHRDKFATTPLPLPPSFNEADVSDKPAFIREEPLLTAEQTAAVQEAYQQQLESLLAVDEAVAAVVGALRAAGELGRTLIVFTADNGFMHGQHRRPTGKNLVYEPAIRVPLVVRGPGVPGGIRLRHLVANVDLAPTVVDAANARAGRRMDGRSLLPLVASPRKPWRSAVSWSGATRARRVECGTRPSRQSARAATSGRSTRRASESSTTSPPTRTSSRAGTPTRRTRERPPSSHAGWRRSAAAPARAANRRNSTRTLKSA